MSRAYRKHCNAHDMHTPNHTALRAPSHLQLGLTIACLVLQVAYLASSLFLDYKDDTIILVVNTLSTDLKSDNYLVGMPPSLILHLAA